MNYDVCSAVSVLPAATPEQWRRGWEIWEAAREEETREEGKKRKNREIESSRRSLPRANNISFLSLSRFWRSSREAKTFLLQRYQQLFSRSLPLVSFFTTFFINSRLYFRVRDPSRAFALRALTEVAAKNPVKRAKRYLLVISVPSREFRLSRTFHASTATTNVHSLSLALNIFGAFNRREAREQIWNFFEIFANSTIFINFSPPVSSKGEEQRDRTIMTRVSAARKPARDEEEWARVSESCEEQAKWEIVKVRKILRISEKDGERRVDEAGRKV